MHSPHLNLWVFEKVSTQVSGHQPQEPEFWIPRSAEEASHDCRLQTAQYIDEVTENVV
jgi:hypothetical protein